MGGPDDETTSQATGHCMHSGISSRTYRAIPGTDAAIQLGSMLSPLNNSWPLLVEGMMKQVDSAFSFARAAESPVLNSRMMVPGVWQCEGGCWYLCLSR
eukprot:2364279-Rhodomonas_salina.3